MPRARRDCVVFAVPALPAGYVLPPPQASAPPAPPPALRPLPVPWRSKRPCHLLPAVSLDQVLALNAAI